MRRILVTGALLVLVSGSAVAADDPMARASELFRQRHYNEAVSVLRPKVRSIQKARRGTAYLTLGMIYLRNAELHQEFYRTSLMVQLDYLKKLSRSKRKSRSRFADLYYGEALIEAGNYTGAVAPLERFLANEQGNPKHRDIAKAALGLSYYLDGKKNKATKLWNGLDTADPEVLSTLAAAYSTAGLKDKKPAALAEKSLAAQKKSRRRPSMRFAKNLLAVYVRDGATEKGLSLISRASLEKYSYREVIRRNKVINFYDLSLLRDLSTLYLQASIAALRKAAEDGKLRDTANYYLGEAYALSGNTEESSRVTTSFIAAARMPQQFKDRAMARQAANLYRQGNKSEARDTWKRLSKKQPADPDLLAEIMLSCTRLRTDCGSIARKAASVAEAGEGKKFYPLNIALGRYYFGKQDYAKAITFMEAGRDKGNKNKIESNDPVVLVTLAEAYFRTKQYSEALEVYFEMSKQFAEVRQIQEAMQGIYSMEHKSAGDVKIF